MSNYVLCILEEFAMFNRNTKLFFWIVPVICVIFPPTKGKFVLVSLTKVYIFISYNFFSILEVFLLEVFYTKSRFRLWFSCLYTFNLVNLTVYCGRGQNRLKHNSLDSKSLHLHQNNILNLSILGKFDSFSNVNLPSPR
mgnify:CR=1 FL=1